MKLLLSLCLLLSPLSALAASPVVTVLRDDAAGFDFEAVFADPAVASIQPDGIFFSRLEIPGLLNTGIAGDPALPSIRYRIGVPEGECRIRVSGSGGGTGTLSIPLAPVPDKRFAAGSRLDEDVYTPDAKVYTLPQFPAQGAIRTEYSMVGNQRVMTMTLYPVVYAPVSRSYEYRKTIRVSVQFSGRTGEKRPFAMFERILRRRLLNYKTAEQFRVPAPLSKRAAMAAFPLSGTQGVYKIAIRNSSEFSVDGEGLYRLTGQDILNAGGSLPAIDVGEVRLYTSSYGVVLEPNYAPGMEEVPALCEVPVAIRDLDSDGHFGAADEMVFFAAGLTRFSPTDSDFVFQIHPYDYTNYYWLTLNGNTLDAARRLDTLAWPTALAGRRAETFVDRIHREVNLINPTRGSDYFKVMNIWRELTHMNYSFAENVHGYLQKPSDGNGKITLQVDDESGNVIDMINTAVMLNGSACPGLPSNGQYLFSSLAPGGDNTVSIGQMSGDNSRYYLDWYEVQYNRRLALSGAPLLVYGFPGQDTLFEYAVTGASASGALCLDVSDPLNPRLLSTVIRNDSLLFKSAGFYPSHDSLSRRKFCIATPSVFKQVASLTPYSQPSRSSCIRDLRNPSRSCDYVIITPAVFYEAAKRLAVHRTTFEADAVRSARVVLLEDVYDYFSGGKVDPSAIRNLIFYAASHWGASYAVLMGSGHRDYKGSPVPSYIPAYEPFDTAENNLIRSPLLLNGGTTDDFYAGTPGYSGVPGGTRIFIGRFPVNSLSEANWVVDKIIRFDTDNLSMKIWKNRALLVADDDMQLSKPDELNGKELNHMRATENVAQNCLPASMEKVKIYLQRYPVKSTTREKPEAEYDMVEAVNQGTLVWVYVGHGSYEQLADEKVFTLAKTFGRLRNYDKCGFFWAASCSVGEFDNANEGSICTRLILAENSGAVATVGASRKSYATPNADLMYHFFEALFLDSSGPAVSLGEALADAKLSSSGGDNSRYYNLFGDPAMYLYPRHGSVVIDSESALDTLKMLQKIHLTGHIADVAGEKCFGSMAVRLAMPDQVELIKYFKDSSYTVATQAVIKEGSNMVSLIADIRNSAFTLDFVIPKSVPFYTNGSSLNYFAWYGGHIAEKTRPGLFFSGEPPDSNSAMGDGSGPRLSLYVNSQKNNGLLFETAPAGESFSVNRKSVISIVMDDPDGIRTGGENVNEGILYEVVGLFDRRRMTSVNSVDGRPDRKYFTLNVEQELFGITQELSGQEYEFLVIAQDNYDNRSRRTYKLRFESDSSLALSRNEIYNYPNPFKGSTRFIWETTDPADVLIKIFTQSGKLIRVLESRAVRGPYSPGANSVWDGRDQAGHLSARGVYYFALAINRVAGETSSSNTDESKYPEERPITGKMMRY